MTRAVVWSIKEVVEMIKQGRDNKFDSFILVTGSTGTGKSTLMIKIFNRFDDFKLADKLVYKRDKLISLIKDFKRSYALADELISVGNKRKFYDVEQIELVEVITKYRSNQNILMGGVPIFFSLDKELLKLVSMHIQVVERGLAIIHLPIRNRIFSDDIWDVKHNQRLEDEWSKKRQKNPNFRIPFWKYSTFAGFLTFGQLSPKQEAFYEKLKEEGRDDSNKEIEDDGVNDKNFYTKILTMIREKKLNEQGLLQVCLLHDKKLSSVKARLGQILRDEGKNETLGDFFKETKEVTKIDNNLYKNNTVKVSEIDL